MCVNVVVCGLCFCLLCLSVYVWRWPKVHSNVWAPKWCTGMTQQYTCKILVIWLPLSRAAIVLKNRSTHFLFIGREQNCTSTSLLLLSYLSEFVKCPGAIFLRYLPILLVQRKVSIKWQTANCVLICIASYWMTNRVHNKQLAFAAERLQSI